jgi:putative ABC transport system substrate-binding protein
MPTRREILVLGGALSLPRALLAQAQKTLKVAWFSEGTLERHKVYLDAFKTGLKEYGYVEGKNLAIDYYWRGDSIKNYNWLARDVVSAKPDVIFTTCEVTTEAARRATGTIPIVMATSTDPVMHGLVPSLARPGGNITGQTSNELEITPKRLELLREVVPKLARVGVLRWTEEPISQPEMQALERAAQMAKVTLVFAEAEKERDFPAAFDALRKAGAQGLLDYAGITFNFPFRKLIAELAIKAKLPSMFFIGEVVDEGGLMSYGPNVPERFRTAARYVDKIAKGAKPADLPIEQPTRLELAINLKTAAAIGVTVPKTLLLRADRVIE